MNWKEPSRVQLSVVGAGEPAVYLRGRLLSLNEYDLHRWREKDACISFCEKLRDGDVFIIEDGGRRYEFEVLHATSLEVRIDLPEGI